MKRNGFTLVELIVAMPIGAIIVLVAIGSYFQVTKGKAEIAQKSVAINDVDNAAHRICQDLLLAQDTDLVEDAEPVSTLYLEWSDFTHWAADVGTIDHSVNYYLSENQLFRSCDGQVTVIGRYITYAGFSIDDRVFTVILTSQPGLFESAVTRTLTVEMRVDDTS